MSTPAEYATILTDLAGRVRHGALFIIPYDADALEAGARALREQRPDCIWAEDDDGIWDTGCGHVHSFTLSGPADNGQKFCGYCGGRLIERPTPEEVS